ncbi:cholesterol esterase [Cladophialophora chaetospira]|uniref:Cholesterol esterase n=1 Tax=Cladophialophora chaetospira TaxID=386627 RepID=A0AA38XDS4_9EURO|nr:cholesterol esterase [Cladophialophora chaetospira]
MARVPFIGRLFWREYLALLGSLILVALEVFVRIITLGLPQPIIRFCYNTSKSLFNRLSSQRSKHARSQQKHTYTSIATCSDFTELCGLFGYYAEEHVVQTGDGYLLGVHRLPYRKGEEEGHVRVNAGPDSTRKPVIYLHHGLMMNSEVWVCLTEEERCLPFTLVKQGYDVWLGNNRGNKYSKKQTKHSPMSTRFWNFSMDEFAFHDIPNTIDYILSTTSQPSLSYIGFSQGTAQAFATLSIHPQLNDKVNLFIALAPAMSPAGLSNGIVDALVKTNPNILFLAFGRKSILSSATMWQSILYPPIFVRLIDMSLSFLFAWYGRNITVQQKLAAYPHLYSFTSTKSVVHWFQIIRNKSFQMYDDDSTNKFSIGANRYYKVAKFPTRNIKTPIVLVYGGSDSLVDIRVMLRELPRHTIATEIPHFEHLDFLWAQDVDTLVFPHVLEALRYYTAGRTSNGLLKGALSITDTAYLHRRHNSSSSGANWSEDDSAGGYSDYEGAYDSPRTPKAKSFAQQQRERHYKQSSPVQTHSHTNSPLQYQYKYASPTPSRPAVANHSMSWIEEYNKLPKRDVQSPNDDVEFTSNNRNHDAEDAEIEYDQVQNGASSSSQSLRTPVEAQEEQPTLPPRDQSPLSTQHHDDSTLVAQDITTTFAPAHSTSISLTTEAPSSPLSNQDLRDRNISHAPPAPSAPHHQPNASTSDPTHMPESGNASGTDHPSQRRPQSRESLAASGRTTPSSINRGTPPSFTAHGIQVGSGRPSVAVGPATGPEANLPYQ